MFVTCAVMHCLFLIAKIEMRSEFLDFEIMVMFMENKFAVSTNIGFGKNMIFRVNQYRTSHSLLFNVEPRVRVLMQLERRRLVKYVTL